MKMNPAETQLYTILAERVDMGLDEWIQSLPRAELVRLEAEEPENYIGLMLDFGKRMLDAGDPASETTPFRQSNWRRCERCRASKYASAFPGGDEICRSCRRKEAQTEEVAGPAIEEKKSDPANDGRYRECEQCGQLRYKSVFAPQSKICKHCEKEKDEVEAQPEPVRTIAPVALVKKRCPGCNMIKPPDEFSGITPACKACIADEEERLAARRKKETA